VIKLYNKAIEQAELGKSRLQKAGWILMLASIISILAQSAMFSIVFVLLTTMAFISSVAMESRVQQLKTERLEEQLQALDNE